VNNIEESGININKEEIKKNNMEFAKSFSKQSINYLKKLYGASTTRNITSEQVKKYTERPYDNADNLQAAMNYIMHSNGMINEFLYYKADMLMLDHWLLCIDTSKYKDYDKYDKAYCRAVQELRKYNIKFNVSWMIRRLIRDGELYIYKQADSEGITFLPIPNKFCQISSAKGAVQNYSFNIDAMNDELIQAFPDDIQNIYDKKKKGSLKKDKNYKDGYYPLDKTKAYAFSLEYLMPKSVPYYTSLLTTLFRLTESEDIDSDNAEVDNFKLIQMIIPTDKNTGEVLANGDEAADYFYDTKQEIPRRIGFVGLPYELKGITLGDVNNKDLDYSNKLRDSAYDSAGISTEMFNSERSNTQAVVYSQITDSILGFELLKQFKAFLNEDFKSNNALKNFEICFLETTRYNYLEVQNSMMSNVTTYNSKLQMLASQQLEPYQAYNVIKQEELMDLNNKLLPMVTSHTMTGDETNNDTGGRPSVKEETGDGNRTGQAQN